MQKSVNQLKCQNHHLGTRQLFIHKNSKNAKMQKDKKCKNTKRAKHAKRAKKIKIALARQLLVLRTC